MFATVAAWMSAAKDAVETALPDAYVTIGPLVTTEDIGGLDLVIIGHDDSAAEPTAFQYEGTWHDNRSTTGEVRVPVTLLSVGSGTDDMAAQIVLADTLHAAVIAALVPSMNGALGVTGLMWAQETTVVAAFIPTETGPLVRLVCTFTLATLIE